MRHSVVLEYHKCRGCTTCIKNCPTEAIRVRNGKATILPNRCIDCGTCLRVCPHHAVTSMHDNFNSLQNYQYTVAVPDPALYGQFHNLDSPDLILASLLELGFDSVYEAAAGAELLTGYLTSRPEDPDRPVPEISSVCPAVVRLIRIRFPSLLGNICPLLLPTELAAILAREKAVRETGLSPQEIGVFSIVPCSSLVTAASSPDGQIAPVLDGAFAIRDVYKALLSPMKALAGKPLPDLSLAGRAGAGWAFSGGESYAHRAERYVAVDGIDNVIRMLEEIEDGRLPEADFIELRACTQGWLGGCFCVENPFIARMRMKRLMGELPEARSVYRPGSRVDDLIASTQKPEYYPTFQLDPDRRVAMEKMRRIQALEEQLPGLRCGSCGAPSCRAFAEDVVMGRASEDDCIFKVRERMQNVTGKSEADEYLPAPFRRRRTIPQDPPAQP